MNPIISSDIATLLMIAFFAGLILCSLGILVWEAIKPDPKVYCNRDLDHHRGQPDELWIPTGDRK